MSARLPVETLIDTVISKGLCTRCGTCVGACPAGTLRIADPIGGCLPEADDSCTSCGLCLAACPGASVDFAPLEKRHFGEIAGGGLLGIVRGAYLAHAADPGIRVKGSSGGVVTSLLLDLLARGEVRGALLFAPHETEPWRGWGKAVSGADEIIAAAQSRYHLSPLNTVLAELPRIEGSFAYAGLPCQVHGLRKLESAGWAHSTRLDPVIGLYCGNNLFYEATRAMLRKLGVRRLEDIETLSYREGAWPGAFTARTSSGAVHSISKLDFNQAIPFYVNRRCLFCIDFANELADLSVGDGWAKEGAGDGGWSVVITRTARGEQVFDAAVRGGALRAERIPIGAAERMHAHAFDLKKTGSFLRLGLWARWGCPVPRYDRRAPRVRAWRRAAEFFISLQFALASSSAGRFLFAVVPARALGRVFRSLRRIWISRAASRMKGEENRDRC